MIQSASESSDVGGIPFPTAVILKAVDSYGVYPRRKRASSLETIQRLPEPQEGLLNQVVDVILARSQTQEEAGEFPNPLDRQTPSGILVAPPDGL